MYPYFTLLGYKIPTYIICAGIGLVIATFFLGHMLKKKFIFKKYKWIILMAFLGMLCGAKLFSILSYSLYSWNKFKSFSLIESIKNSGIVFYGGLIGYIISYHILCKIFKYDFREISDELSITIPLFHAFGRIGCYLMGCCYGKLSISIIAFPYRIGFDGKWCLRLPTQIIETVFEFAICIFLYLFYKSNNKPLKDNLLNLYLVSYAIFRFLIEFFRGDEIRGHIGFISFSQIISVFIIFTLILKKTKERID